MKLLFGAGQASLCLPMFFWFLLRIINAIMSKLELVNLTISIAKFRVMVLVELSGLFMNFSRLSIFFAMRFWDSKKGRLLIQSSLAVVSICSVL